MKPSTNMKPPVSSSVALMACGALTCSAVRRAFRKANIGCGPMFKADSPPARWREPELDNL